MHELDRCVVFSGSQVVVDGYVRSYVDGVMRVESDDLLAHRVESGAEVSALVFDSVRGECHYWARAGVVDARGLELVAIEIVQTVQKREVARVRTQLPYVGVLEPLPGTPSVADDGSSGETGAGDGEEQHEGAARGRPLVFTVLDVSAHGIQVQSKAKLVAGRRFSFVFEQARVPLDLTAEVIRVTESMTGYRYGCRFVDHREHDAEELFRFVMQQQGFQRRNRLLS